MPGDREQLVRLEAAAQPARGATTPYFPDTELVPETKRHLELRTLLYQVLKLAFADRAAIGCDQFVYWDPSNPRACLAPDAFVHLGEADHLFRSWKVWEHGAPQVAVEIISEADERDRDWNAKLEKYRRLGVTELVRFDPESDDRPLRIWERSETELVERVLSADRGAQSRCLPGYWVLVQEPDLGLALRLSHDPQAERLFPTLAERQAEAHRVEAEAHRVEAEARQAEAEAQRANEAKARLTAERRIRELEAELLRRERSRD